MPNRFHRHYHLGVQGTPSVTCYVVETEKKSTGPQKSYISFSICNPSDNFSRELGRTISTNRYESNKYVEVYRWEENYLIEDILEGLEQHLESNEDEFHKRVYEVLVYYHYSPEYLMESVESKQEEPYGFYYGKVLPYLSKFRIFQRWFYGI